MCIFKIDNRHGMGVVLPPGVAPRSKRAQLARLQLGSAHRPGDQAHVDLSPRERMQRRRAPVVRGMQQRDACRVGHHFGGNVVDAIYTGGGIAQTLWPRLRRSQQVLGSSLFELDH